MRLTNELKSIRDDIPFTEKIDHLLIKFKNGDSRRKHTIRRRNEIAEYYTKHILPKYKKI